MLSHTSHKELFIPKELVEIIFSHLDLLEKFCLARTSLNTFKFFKEQVLSFPSKMLGGKFTADKKVELGLTDPSLAQYVLRYCSEELKVNDQELQKIKNELTKVGHFYNPNFEATFKQSLKQYNGEGLMELARQYPSAKKYILECISHKLLPEQITELKNVGFSKQISSIGF